MKILRRALHAIGLTPTRDVIRAVVIESQRDDAWPAGVLYQLDQMRA